MFKNKIIRGVFGPKREEVAGGELSYGAESFLRSSVGLEIPRLLQNLKAHCRFHNSPPLDPVLSQLNPVHTRTPAFVKILILRSHPRLGLPSGRLHSLFLDKNIDFISYFTMHATCPGHVNPFDRPNNI